MVKGMLILKAIMTGEHAQCKPVRKMFFLTGKTFRKRKVLPVINYDSQGSPNGFNVSPEEDKTN